MSEEEYLDYEVFEDETRNGDIIELAVVDKFEFEGKHYVAAALVENDEISEEGLFVYRSTRIKDEIIYSKIEDADEYEKVASAYAEME